MSGSITQQRRYVGFAFETLTISNTAIGLTTNKYRPTGADAGKIAEKAFVTCEGGSVRYRYDGEDPTVTVGHILEAGGYLVLEGQNQMNLIKFIRKDGADATLQITYERE